MATLNFPNAPTLGQTHTQNGVVWEWNGVFWAVVPGDAGAAPIHIGPTPPADPAAGDLWFKDTEPTNLLMYYTDPDSSQWIAVSGAMPPAIATPEEALAGTDNTKMMTPALVRGVSGTIPLVSFGFAGLQTYEFDVPPECYGFEYDFVGFLPSVNPQALLMQFGDAADWEGAADTYVNAQIFMSSRNTLGADTTNYFGAFITTNIDVPNGNANAGWGRATGFNWPVPRWGHLNGSSMGVTKIGANPAFEQKAEASIRTVNQKIWTRARFVVGSGVINQGSAIVRGLLR